MSERLGKVEEFVFEKFYSALVREDLEEQEKHVPEPDKVSVTEIVYACPRYSYLLRKYGQEQSDMRSVIRTWIGRKLHETQILEYHELELEWENIRGIVDEYEGGIAIEKKTIMKAPRSPLEHHIRQCEYYRVLLEENGYPVIGFAILYIPLVQFDDIYVYDVTDKLRDIDTVKQEMIERRDKLLQAIQADQLPPRHTTWLCRYCNNFYRCFSV